VETLGMKQELGDARPALRFQIGIVAVPLEWRGLRNSSQSAIGHAVAPQLRRFQIPRNAIDMVGGVAGGAGKLSLETEARGMEHLLAAAQLGQLPPTTEINRSAHLQ